MMKKSFILLAGLALLLMAPGCKKFLSTLPTDFTSVENFYGTEEELEQALAAVYSTLNRETTFGRNLTCELAHGSDELFYKRDNTTLTPAKYDHDPADAAIQLTWAELYSGINRANLLLANLHRPDMDETARNRIRGEVLFLRAFFYFQLVHHWGDIPVYLTPTLSGEQVDFPRTGQREVYELILKDMKEAEGLVPPISAYTFSGRITKTAVQGILTRVCLKMAGQPLNDAGKWAEAKYWASKVIASGEHRLNPDYAQIFRNHTQDIYDTKENIWEIEFAGNITINPLLRGGHFAKYFSIRNSSNELYGYGFYGPPGIHYKRYDDPKDVRRNRNIATFRYNPVSTGNPGDTIAWNPTPATQLYNRDAGKWRVYEELLSPKNRNVGPTNFPVLRYADALLMFAEADNEINGPTDSVYWALNEVRMRAKAYLYHRQNAPTKEVLRDVLREERARELCYEGLRKFDLIRWGIFVETIRKTAADFAANAQSGLQYAVRYYNNVNERHLYLPIPSRELTLNKSMTQNPGW